MQAPRENAVLVFGSTGKLGRQIVTQLLEEGRTVVAAARDAQKADTVFEELGLRVGYQADKSKGILALEGDVDITNPESLNRPELWAGVSQVACAVGPIFGRLPDGKMGYLDDMTSERVDAQGVANIASALQSVFKDKAKSRETATVLPMTSEADLVKWQRLDDVIMGGQSSSALTLAADGSGAVFSGDLIIEGGGFCGARTKALDLNLGEFDGVALEVEGDGQTFKLNLKTADQEDLPECTFQATFDTLPGRSTTVYIPWREFVAVKRARVDPAAPKLDPSSVRQLGLVLSRFEFNGLANPNYWAGKFSLKIKGGIQGFREPRPAIVFVTSAGVERNAKIGDDETARKADIPIVQLNPGGVLNHKYAGEWAVRSAGIPYAVVRSTGLTSEDEDTDFVLEASQGDRISGKISRKEVARVAVAALGTAASVGKTVEIRRSEAAGDRGKASSQPDLERLFLTAVQDRHRPRINLAPLPAPVPPPKPPTPERTAEILSDERVQAAQAAGRGGRVRSEEETSAATSVTVVGDNRAQVSAPGQNGAQPQGDGDEAVPQNVKEARDWIRSWRASNLERKLPQEEKAGVNS
ncbi:CIA30-domain-containing protein [Coccomyxa subellipsoidea C-169]|uniref:CIA30-domain-containing protein n=1 Tax=Coccomyxa subellipsoidea (strain C-169) TaxID=574566 RepID=I0YX59_COCSC|nr:CIA30-domain-containing protein [Coccomyxa subellipsoidea C-169]EIE22978.1 CIA30-domain-containing protein [Coccomyxa subellipsoidea C-169]|eukprot:XP_005647522.1 CIA30-domain-containing protein [Coccomyxa subellipsoidea C-169]